MAIFNIAPGHGANDPGAVSGVRKEKDDNLRFSLELEAELLRRGHKVNMFRRDDSVNCSAKLCREWLERTVADFSIVPHRNAASGKGTGVEVWSFDDEKSVRIATSLSSEISKASGLYNRGRKGNGAAWLSPNVPCCEPEIGFIDNTSDNTKFDNSFNAIVNAVCDTLEKHYGKGTVADGVIAIGTTTNFLNIRTAPVNGAVLISMPTGSKCNIFSIENGWAYLEYNGYKGYSSTDYMTIEYIKQEKPKEEEEPIIGEKPKEETKPSESDSEGVNSEVLEKGGTIPETLETEASPEPAPNETVSTENEELGLDETIPPFIKLLKQIIKIILNLWRKEK